MKHLWKFIQDESIEITGEIKGEELLREKDSMFATNFARSNRVKLITKGEQISANRYRLFLQVISVTDITTWDGDEIDANFWKGARQSWRSHNIEWPTHERPSKHDWTVWRRVLILSLGSWYAHILNF